MTVMSSCQVMTCHVCTYHDVTLRYDGEADGDPGDGVRHGVIEVVLRQPAQDGEPGLHTRHEAV